MKNKHQPVCCSVSSVCLILQGSGSLIFSLSSLINSVFDQISALPDVLMLVFTSVLMGIFQHLLLNYRGRSFTDHVIAVGGAELPKSKNRPVEHCAEPWVYEIKVPRKRLEKR